MTLSSAAAAIARTHDRPGGRARIGKTKKLLSSLFSFIGDHQIIGEVAGGGKKKKKKTVRSNSDGKQVVVERQHRIASLSFVPQCRTRPGGTGRGTRWSRFQRLHSSIVDHLHVTRILMEERSDVGGSGSCCHDQIKAVVAAAATAKATEMAAAAAAAAGVVAKEMATPNRNS